MYGNTLFATKNYSYSRCLSKIGCWNCCVEIQTSSSSNFQLSLSLMSTKSYLKFRTISPNAIWLHCTISSLALRRSGINYVNTGAKKKKKKKTAEVPSLTFSFQQPKRNFLATSLLPHNANLPSVQLLVLTLWTGRANNTTAVPLTQPSPSNW